MIGASEELGGAVWDPLGLASVSEQSPELQTLPHVKWLRESELKHGRICMLAFVGIIVTQAGVSIPSYPTNVAWTDALGAAIKNNPAGMAQIFILLTILEGYFYPGEMWTGGGDREAGDFGFDYLNLMKKQTPESLNKLKLQELKNGRAAMIAVAGFASEALIDQSVPPFHTLGF
eukprot:scaffold417_cov252-Pinguiococcus_pyrenoidosus.AAC.3